MKTLTLFLLSVLVAGLAACHSTAPAKSASGAATAVALPEIRYYEIAET
jgi:hypothetical protein